MHSADSSAAGDARNRHCELKVESDISFAHCMKLFLSVAQCFLSLFSLLLGLTTVLPIQDGTKVIHIPSSIKTQINCVL